MKERAPYKPTFFDRHGPDGMHRLMAFGYGLMVFGLVFGISGTLMPGKVIMRFVVAVVCGVGTAAFGLNLSDAAGAAYKHLMVNGSTTPYAEQFSYQQSLVMQGRVDDALASFEAVIAESPEQIAARIKAAELYLRDSRNPTRAFELLKDAQRVPSITPGEDVYVSNRLADILSGPLEKPGAALAELRRLVDRHPDLPAAAQARQAIARIKATLMPASEPGSQA